eukprot:bmy_01360T0
MLALARGGPPDPLQRPPDPQLCVTENIVTPQTPQGSVFAAEVLRKQIQLECCVLYEAISSEILFVAETGMQEIRSSGAGAGLPPGEGARARILGQQGARVTRCPAQRPPPCTEARRWPGATKRGGSSGRWKELGPALPKMHCGGVFFILQTSKGSVLNKKQIVFLEMQDPREKCLTVNHRWAAIPNFGRLY